MIEQLDEAHEYVTSLTRDEAELVAAYDQALAMIHGHGGEGQDDDPDRTRARRCRKPPFPPP